RDPIQKARSRFIAEGSFTAAELDSLDERAAGDVARAVEYAEASPEPDVSEALRDIFAETK
ncbi:MAG TPA: ABC transporter substrate-binding protein, partial [Treponema sp.]|nr:ABC transporter substrate-binding protein [Treponema sp.]